MKNSTKVLLMIIIVVIILILSIFIILQFPNKQKCEKSEKIMEIGVLHMTLYVQIVIQLISH